MVKWSSNHCILCIIYVLSWILYKLMVIWRFLYWSMGEYVILQCVPSTVILWIEVSWWRKGYSNNATLLLGGRHRYKKRRHHNLAVRYEISISQMTMDILLLRIFFSFLYRYQDFWRTWLYIDIRVKTMFGSSLPPIVLGGLLSYLRCLCLFAHSGVQHILCCFCFVFLVYPMFPISLDCPFWLLLRCSSKVYLHSYQ